MPSRLNGKGLRTRATGMGCLLFDQRIRMPAVVIAGLDLGRGGDLAERRGLDPHALGLVVLDELHVIAVETIEARGLRAVDAVHERGPVRHAEPDAPGCSHAEPELDAGAALLSLVRAGIGEIEPEEADLLNSDVD